MNFFTVRLILLSLLWQTLAPAVLLATDDFFLDVKHEGSRVHLVMKEKSDTLLDQHFDTSCGVTNFRGGVIAPHDGGFLLRYESPTTAACMDILISPTGDIVLGDDYACTLNDLLWTWSFHTSGTLINHAQLLFHIIHTRAQQFHNYGIIKALTGKMVMDYKFNQGVFDFGDGQTPIFPEAYPWDILDEEATPCYESGVVDDCGIFLTQYGHKITGLKYRAKGLYLNEGHLELHNASFVSFTEACSIKGLIQGQATFVGTEPDTHLFVGGFAQDIQLGCLNNQGGLSIGSDQTEDLQTTYILPASHLDNSGEIVCEGLLQLRTRRFPSDVGKITALGLGVNLLDGVDGNLHSHEPPPHQIKGNLRTITKTKHYIDYYLNTITTHRRLDGYSHTTETGPVFQYRVLIGEDEEINEEMNDMECIVALSRSAAHRKVLAQVKENIRKNLSKLAAMQANKNDLMYGLAEVLDEAGLSSADIDELLGDPEIESLLTSVAGFNELNDEEQDVLRAEDTFVGRVLSQATAVARRSAYDLSSWVKNNPGHVMALACAAAATLPISAPPAALAVAASMATDIVVASRLRALAISAGALAAGSQEILNTSKYRTFFNEKKDSVEKVTPKGDTPLSNITGPMGRKGFELKNHSFQPFQNQPDTIDGLAYSSHSLDQMRNRGILPSVVKQAIQKGYSYPTRPDTVGYYDMINDIRVVISQKTRQVITVIRGKP